VTVRSGAEVPMPGLLDTVFNVGLASRSAPCSPDVVSDSPSYHFTYHLELGFRWYSWMAGDQMDAYDGGHKASATDS